MQAWNCISFSDPGNGLELSIAREHVAAVMPVPMQMYASGARAFIKTDITEFNPSANQLVATVLQTREHYSEIMRRLGVEVSAAVIETEQKTEEHFRVLSSKIALPDSATASNLQMSRGNQ